MKIWKREITVEMLNGTGKNTMLEAIGIRFTECGDDYIKATMPVDKRTHQPYGILHGGASVSLAETMGSTASFFVLPPEDDRWCVGIEINANHIRSVTEGEVTGTVRPVHLGRSLHVWEIKITEDSDKLVCVSRLTVSVIPKRT